MSWRCSSVREDLTESNRTLCSVEAEDRCVVGSKAKAEIPTTSTFEVFSVEALSREKRSPVSSSFSNRRFSTSCKKFSFAFNLEILIKILQFNT